MVMSVVAALFGSKSRADAAPADVMGRRCRGGSGKVPPPALGQRFVEMLWLGWPQRAVAKRPAVAPAGAAARAAAPAPAPAPTSTAHATLGGQAGYARVFRCYVCGEAFPSKRRLQHHTRTEHAAPDAPAAPAKRLVNGRCNTCGWKTCQCETAPVWAAPPPPRRRRSAPDRPADKRQEWFMRVRDRYERRGGSMDDVSVPPCLSDDRRSANRVLQAQVLLLREMGFSRAHAEAYADAELQLHVILDVMCDDGVEGEDQCINHGLHVIDETHTRFTG